MSNNNTGNKNTGNFNTGCWNSGDGNTGEFNTGNRNTGDENSGCWNSGNRNTGDLNTGDRNTGYRNTGDLNTGCWNSGYENTGYRNTGAGNTGGENTGNRNTGDLNTGCWNSGSRNTGYLNTNTPKVRIFNKMCDIGFSDIEFPSFFYFNVVEWISEENMTDSEKDSYPSYVTTKGFLKCYDYKQAFKDSYLKANKEDRNKVKELPNFDADLFYEISGIRVGEEKKKVTLELTDEQLEKIKDII